MSATLGLFRKYMNPVFIETGALIGTGIQIAINSGFKTIYSIERDKLYFKMCTERFADYPNVNIILGDSRQELSKLIGTIEHPITFWLDGHDDNDYPVLEELETIKTHPLKNHTILIDDLRMFDRSKNGIDISILREKLLQINPDYTFTLEEGYTENDILVAKI